MQIALLILGLITMFSMMCLLVLAHARQPVSWGLLLATFGNIIFFGLWAYLSAANQSAKNAPPPPPP